MSFNHTIIKLGTWRCIPGPSSNTLATSPCWNTQLAKRFNSRYCLRCCLKHSHYELRLSFSFLSCSPVLIVSVLSNFKLPWSLCLLHMTVVSTGHSDNEVDVWTLQPSCAWQDVWIGRVMTQIVAEEAVCMQHIIAPLQNKSDLGIHRAEKTLGGSALYRRTKHCWQMQGSKRAWRIVCQHRGSGDANRLRVLVFGAEISS